MFNGATKIYLSLLTGFSILPAGCASGKKVPNLQAIFAQAKKQEGKRPVIIIPGILGSELINSETQERVWLNFSTSKTDGLDLPISPNLEQNRDKLVPATLSKKQKSSDFCRRLPSIKH